MTTTSGPASPSHVTVRFADWDADGDAIREIRRQVFVLEQNVPAGIDLDGSDSPCIHSLALNQNLPVGTCRLDLHGRIGRLAVLKDHRRLGIGSRLMEFIIALAIEKKFPQVNLHSQVAAIPFYQSLGFSVHGDQFLEANIPHVSMVKIL